MFDKLAAEFEKFNKDGVKMKHEFDWITIIQLFLVVFFGILLPLLIYSQIPKK